MNMIGNNPINAYANRNYSGTAARSRMIAEQNDKRTNAREIKMKLASLKKSNAAAVQYGSDAIYDSMAKYRESLKAQRQNTGAANLNKKKVKYNFTSISSKIIRSKTSVSARQVVGQAQREIASLKRAKQSGKYDSDEIDAAIEHAKAMERVARKKVKHLEEEEMMRAAGMCAGDSIEEEKDRDKEDKQVENPEENSGANQDVDSGANQDISAEDSSSDYENDAPMEWSDIHSIDDLKSYFGVEHEMTQELLEELEEGMKDILEEMGLAEMTEGILGQQEEPDPENLKELRIKHRNKEMKDMVKANAEYLKSMFEHLSKISQQQSAGAISGNSEGAMPAAIGAEITSPASAIDVSL